MKIGTVVSILCIIVAIAGFAMAKMDDKVDQPFTGIKDKLVNIASGKSGGKSSGADSVTVKAGSSGHLLNGQVMISVSKIVINKEVGNGAAFAVALPHKTFTARVKAGRRFTIQVNQESYLLDFQSVTANSATFSVMKGVKNEDDES